MFKNADLMVSTNENYINELFYYWYYYYQIRSLTLWDYENEKEIYLDLDDFM